MQNNQEERTQMKKRAGCVFLTVFFIMIFSFQSFAGQLTEIQKDLEQKNSSIQKMGSQIKSMEADLNWNKKKRENLIKELEAMGLKKEEVEQRIQLLESALQSLDEAIAMAEAEYVRQEDLLKERLRVMHKRTVSVWELDELFQCKSLNELIIRIRMMQQITEADQRLLDSVEEKRMEIEDLKEQKQIEIDNCLEQAQIYTQQIKELEVSRSSLEKQISTSGNKIEEYERIMDQMKKESDELENLIKNMKSMGTDYIGGDMKWPMPTNPNIVSPYGNRLHPIYKVWKMHTGIDIGSALKEPIVAAADGVVIYAGTRGGYGNTIILDHGGGITTLYAHIVNRGILVKKGQYVNAGDMIAKAGMTGTATGPHLHFEVRVNGATKNPVEYVSP